MADAHDITRTQAPADPDRTATGPPSPPSPEPAGVVGDYEIIEEIAHGGMGVVYKARQRSANRLVALKMMLRGPHATELERQRFQIEAEAAASLDHPNIVPIHDVGEWQGQPYFAMRFLDGPTLKGVPRGTPRQEAERLIKIARAVHFAHQRGILHRDLKPGNILTDAAGEPYVTDFGLARRLDADETFTQTGAIMGTPSYMSPEQADGKKSISLSTDLYSLGVILYERLSGRLPFDAESREELLRQVREDEPPRLTSSSGIPRDVETICLKCLRKDPAERYAGVGDLADDLTRYLEGSAIKARPVGGVERTVKWIRRNPAVSALTAAVFLAMAVGTTVSWVKYREAERNAEASNRNAQKARDNAADAELARTEEAKRVIERDAEIKKTTDALGVADERLKELKHRLGISDILLARRAFEDNNCRIAMAHLNRVPVDQRKLEWQMLRRQVGGGGFSISNERGAVQSVGFSPDGAKLAVGAWDNSARVYDARTGAPLVQFEGHESTVESVAFSPDGTRLATASRDKTARIWDAVNGRSLLELHGHEDLLVKVCFSADGARVATASDDGTARIWDARSGRPLAVLRDPERGLTDVGFSPDGNRIATSSLFSLTIWDSLDGTPQPRPVGHDETSTVQRIAFSPDGTCLATVGTQPYANVWNTQDGKFLRALEGGTGFATSVAFSPDGRLVAMGSEDSAVRVWDVATGTLLAPFKGHTSKVTSVAFSPDGSRLCSGSSDGTVLIRRVDDDPPEISVREQEPNDGHFAKVAFSPRGDQVVTGGPESGVARIWNVASGVRHAVLKGHSKHVHGVAFSADGSRVATASEDGTARVWDAETGTLVRILEGHSMGVYGVAFSPDGKRLATASEDGEGRVWDIGLGKTIVKLTGHDGLVSHIVFSPDGSKIATASWDDAAYLWDAVDGDLLFKLTGHTGSVIQVVFSPDGIRLATASNDDTARLWDCQTGKGLTVFGGHTKDVNCLAFSPDGTRLATGSGDSTSRLWDTQSGVPVAVLKGHANSLEGVTFVNDGHSLVTACFSGTLICWDGSPPPETLLDITRDRLRLTSTQVDRHRALLGNAPLHRLRDPEQPILPPLPRRAFVNGLPQQSADLFHADRLACCLPEERGQWLTERNRISGDPVLAARAALHAGVVPNPEDLAPVQVAAAKGERLAQRVIAQHLIRDGQPEKAVPMLIWCLASRMRNAPPVEELHIAEAYGKMGRQAEAKRWHDAAVNWLDRPRLPIRYAAVVTAINPWNKLAELFEPSDDPRLNPFDWESWHECEVFRQRLEGRP